MTRLMCVLLFALAIPVGCTTEAAPEIHDHSNVHDVACGCAIDGVGKCGNYISIDGEFVPLKGEGAKALGKMEFCKKDGLMAEVDGELVDGEFVATSFKYHDH